MWAQFNTDKAYYIIRTCGKPVQESAVGEPYRCNIMQKFKRNTLVGHYLLLSCYDYMWPRQPSPNFAKYLLGNQMHRALHVHILKRRSSGSKLFFLKKSVTDQRFKTSTIANNIVKSLPSKLENKNHTPLLFPQFKVGVFVVSYR